MGPYFWHASQTLFAYISHLYQIYKEKLRSRSLVYFLQLFKMNLRILIAYLNVNPSKLVGELVA